MFAALAAFGAALAAACGPGNATGPGAIVAPTDADAGLMQPAGDAAPLPTVKDEPAPSGAKLCGCSLCEPVFSDDACSSDADCAPSALCHAEACVAKAKAPQRTPGTACTEIMKCATTDANACGCVKGKCALAPRPKS
jgi:hypothetical protein